MSGNEPIATAALGDVLRERVRHMTDLGHDREHDDGLSIDYLPRLAAGRMIIATDRLAAGDRRDLAGARKALVQAAALALAALDRLDRAMTPDTGATLFDTPPGQTPLHMRDWHG